MPEPFYGVGQFYQDFTQVSDEEVTELLDRASQQRDLQRVQSTAASFRR
jgi:predicted phosphoribosyltransferase